MPLPALRADGSLPPGVHRTSLDEIFACFPATTPTRQALNSALADCVATLRAMRLAELMAVDGSYVTGKRNPSDVDVVVFTPGVYQLAGEQRYAAAGIDTKLLNIQFAHDAPAFQGWLAFFSATRAGTAKGVIALTDVEAP